MRCLQSTPVSRGLMAGLRSGLDPTHPKIDLNHPPIAEVWKWAPFPIPAGPHTPPGAHPGAPITPCAIPWRAMAAGGEAAQGADSNGSVR